MEFFVASKVTSLTSYPKNYMVEGFFGQFTADYDNKYYASLSLRFDGSSVFHKDHRWGTFWSVGASWRINQENFMKEVKWVENLKTARKLWRSGQRLPASARFGLSRLYALHQPLQHRNRRNLCKLWAKV